MNYGKVKIYVDLLLRASARGSSKITWQDHLPRSRGIPETMFSLEGLSLAGLRFSLFKNFGEFEMSPLGLGKGVSKKNALIVFRIPPT